jgi:hypothetical protein
MNPLDNNNISNIDDIMLYKENNENGDENGDENDNDDENDDLDKILKDNEYKELENN